MAERKYSVSEIDRMRRAITEVVWDQNWSSKSQAPVIEDRLRTYMLNGTDPEELEALSKPIVEKRAAEDEVSRALARKHATEDAAGR